jgi:muramoyltetrapeptide carboxypeptidase
LSGTEDSTVRALSGESQAASAKPLLGYARPKALQPGATLAVVSPASTPKPELVEQGRARLEELGYRTVLGEHALGRGPLYYAGTKEERIADLHAAFADPAVDGIVCTRGGWGSAELLPHLDVELIRANPKPFIGYSDHTSLHCWLRERANLVSFYGPMCAADFGRANGVDLASWNHALGESATWSLGAADGLRVLRAGTAEGVFDGGCLSIYAEAIGTPFAPLSPAGILFLEDIGTKPYQWDRMLLHLRYAGLLEGVQGIVFGDMRQCVSAEENELLERAILHALGDFAGPIAIGLRSGHVSAPNVTLPLGVRARLDLAEAENPRLHFLEAAVRD